MSNIQGNKSKILTYEQKLELVTKHFEEHKTFRELSEEYGISYSTSRKLCLNHKIYGNKALLSQTGKHNKHIGKIKDKTIDSIDKLIAKQEGKIKKLEMEIEILKEYKKGLKELNKE